VAFVGVALCAFFCRRRWIAASARSDGLYSGSGSIGFRSENFPGEFNRARFSRRERQAMLLPIRSGPILLSSVRKGGQ